MYIIMIENSFFDVGGLKKLCPRSGSAALKQVNLIYKKGQ